MRKKNNGSPEQQGHEALPIPLLNDPVAAANQIDAILYFIHKQYSKNSSNKVPALNSFLIYKAEVVFSKDVKHVFLEKRPAQGVLEIVAPAVSKDKEEERRIFLLREFGDLIIKCQRQAYQQIREMLLPQLDAVGREILISEFLEFKEKEKRRSDALKNRDEEP